MRPPGRLPTASGSGTSSPYGSVGRLPLDAAAAALLALLPLAWLGPVWLRGLTPFWGDLTYIHHPWQAFSAQVLQAGRMPLWDPTLYLGMPNAARMQNALFYPGEVPFFLGGFASALALFQWVHYFLAGWLAFLWLRGLRLSRGACLCGALVYALGGGLVSRLSFLNHLSTLSLAPALLLFFRRPALLGLTLACAFLAGYPSFLIGASVFAWALTLLVLRPSRLGPCVWAWLAGGLLAAALAACQLLPGAELMGLSRRGGGLELAETLRFGYAWRDLRQWVTPLAVPWKDFQPSVEWWKCSYLGLFGCLAAGLGFARLKAGRAAGAALVLAAVLVLILGETTALSREVWGRLAPLKYIRYPGNLAYLALPALALLAACSRLAARRQALLFLGLSLELLAYASTAIPFAPRTLFSTAGPLVRRLQAELGSERYLLSPVALERHAGAGVVDWKTRLYGLTNSPFRLRSAANFGEPLVPRPNYAFMDYLYTRASAEAAARALPWAGARFLLTPGPVAAPSLSDEGETLWRVNRARAPAALAYALDERAGAALPAGLPEGDVALGSPLPLAWGREDRFQARGEQKAAGWVYIAEPRYPGWKAFLETPAGRRRVEPEAALLAFQKVAVPAGPWRLSFRFEPDVWAAGRLVTVGALLAFALYWYNSARMWHAT